MINAINQELGEKSELLTRNLLESRGFNQLDGGKYNTVNGFDHVFITEIDGVEHVMIVDTKQLKNGSAALANTNNGVQMSRQWVDNVLENLDYDGDMAQANLLLKSKIDSAKTNGTLLKGVAGLDKKTGEFSVVKLDEIF